MEARFLRSLYARRSPSFFGLRLRPFSLAHRVALTAIGSPFVANDVPILPRDILIAARICSLSDPFAPIPRPTLADKVRHALLRLSAARWHAKAAEFLAYIGDHTSHPEMWEKEAETPDDGIPGPLHIVARLVRNGIPEREAWSMSEARAVWLAIAFARQEGADLAVVDDKARKAMSILDEAIAAESTKPTPSHG